MPKDAKKKRRRASTGAVTPKHAVEQSSEPVAESRVATAPKQMSHALLEMRFMNGRRGGGRSSGAASVPTSAPAQTLGDDRLRVLFPHIVLTGVPPVSKNTAVRCIGAGDSDSAAEIRLRYGAAAVAAERRTWTEQGESGRSKKRRTL